MKPKARGLLKKIIQMRPKPSIKALEELFVEIKSTDLDSLKEVVRTLQNETVEPTALETLIKRELRRVQGKAGDFIPYLLDELASRGFANEARMLPAKVTLKSVVSLVEQLLESDASLAAENALKKYIDENDVSYKLKTA